MTLDFGALNWLAVIVGAAIYFILGALWYSPPLFARPWQAAIGWDESRPQPQTNPVTYVVPALLYLTAAAATGLIAAATGTDTLTEGITLGLVTGLGFALPMVGVEATFDPNKPKPMTWFDHHRGLPPDRFPDPRRGDRALAVGSRERQERGSSTTTAVSRDRRFENPLMSPQPL